jgi:hypothetical protein
MTELWVEAEAFGAQVNIPENDFPIIKSKVIPDILRTYLQGVFDVTGKPFCPSRGIAAKLS